MYTTPVNMLTLDSAYEVYYKTHEFEKSNYTRYYKRFRRVNRPFVQSDGTLREITLNDIMRKDDKHINTTQASVRWKPIRQMKRYRGSGYWNDDGCWATW